MVAYRELHLRQRINESALATMLAFAEDADLDHIGARYNVERLVVDPGDASAIPPVPATYEPNADFRRRIQLSFEALTTAGSTGSYIITRCLPAARCATHPPPSPAPTQVTVYVLSRTADGAPMSFCWPTWQAALNAEQVRPMTDLVNVLSASIVNTRSRQSSRPTQGQTQAWLWLLRMPPCKPTWIAFTALATT
ncbi:baseplate J/gp47 family protein [Halopseudomonas pachastrellae]|nr:baseplate J/gp47 family protein [Halopseudomonas pachastrellae]